MPVNLDALLRYHTIDHCLQNRFKKWTCDELANACADYAAEVSPRDSRNVPSKRTIQQDIKIMRSADLGYFAPIVNIDGFYSYDDKNYSIKNATLNNHDIENISLASKILGQYKGFDFFKDLNNIFEKFESRLQIQINQQYEQHIEFEKTPAAKGIEFLKPILQAITKKEVIEIIYQKFGDKLIKKHIIHPYLLKEYQSRWYVLGQNHQLKKIITFALDRILDINFLAIGYETISFEHDSYFKNTIGITFTGEKAQIVRLKVDADFAPYFMTKPLHHTQVLLSSDANFSTFEYQIVINQELETMLMSYINHIQIIEPQSLKNSLFDKLQKAINSFL
jgi:predicted DNA-binding transcriptional regulator YafY